MRRRDSYHVGNLAATLLEVARKALEEAGPNKLSLRDVASRAGVSSAAVYHHYANRSALVARLAIVGFNELESRMQQASASSKDDVRLEAAMQAYVEFGRAHPALYQLMFGPEIAACEGFPDLTEASNRSYDAFKRVVAGQLQLDITSAEVAQAALAGWSLGHGLLLLLINGVLQQSANISTKRLVTRALDGNALLLLGRKAPQR